MNKPHKSKEVSKMIGNYLKFSRVLIPLGSLAFAVSLVALPATRPQDPQAPADNTTHNKNQEPPTADQQKMKPEDRATTQKIRKSIHDDSSLSTYAHNVKIITQNGKVTLRGPVRSEEEKNNIQSKAAAVAGEENVVNRLKVAPPSN
jgi:hyperosmotically inducible protein